MSCSTDYSQLINLAPPMWGRGSSTHCVGVSVYYRSSGRCGYLTSETTCKVSKEGTRHQEQNEHRNFPKNVYVRALHTLMACDTCTCLGCDIDVASCLDMLALSWIKCSNSRFCIFHARCLLLCFVGRHIPTHPHTRTHTHTHTHTHTPPPPTHTHTHIPTYPHTHRTSTLRK